MLLVSLLESLSLKMIGLSSKSVLSQFWSWCQRTDTSFNLSLCEKSDKLQKLRNFEIDTFDDRRTERRSIFSSGKMFDEGESGESTADTRTRDKLILTWDLIY